MSRYNFRRWVTSSVGFTFLIVGSTGVFFKLFYTNHTVQDVHGWMGVALVLAALFHIYNNWVSLRGHLADRRIYLLLLPILIAICVIVFAPDDEEEGKGPKPKQIVAQLSHGRTVDVAKALGQDTDSVMAAMKQDGIKVQNSDETLETIANANGKPLGMILRYFMH